ncbi:polyribonucleotide nucleotidyltransferase [Bacteroidetes bacterium endosymbiont of Geopemphigus sp.]|uniref:polyribonucleotide nucleotidyltransferase n=1 Tax=Bacteroidetes bacterium endosymbiont of Geopemphigus sp. TaxID=2047937 RepID=UPI000CD177B3|nr:polyribonucleotide nucleotidyltransferase [Bacteroidetes bacterium endosymbiont of Geopemphigus sp.]
MKSYLISEKILLEDGRSISIETGLLARQADGSVVIRMGDTMLLATVVAAKEAKEEVDFLPLTVDYREKYSAGGKIPGGFIKREGRPSDEEILTMRIVDRVLRPIFPKDFHTEVQVMISLLSYDGQVLPDGLAGLAASAALSVSDIPFHGPISGVRIVRSERRFIINPSLKQALKADIDMIIGGSKESIIMVEGEMKEISENEMLQAIEIAHEAIKDQIEAQLRLMSKIEKSHPKRTYTLKEQDKELYEKIRAHTYESIYEASKNSSDKKKRLGCYELIFNEMRSSFSEEDYEKKEELISHYYADIKKEAIRALLLNEDVRLDGRSSRDIRPIWSCVDYLPGVHGAAIFTRGETQSLTTVTLGSSIDANRIDNAIKAEQEKFYLHYNFPPFSTGEVRPLRGVSRREIGHGNLAQRALKSVIPSNTPYTIRVVSDILESNGSSSMATVCAGTLALMDAGIPITSPVSGIAMGLIIDQKEGKEVILSDILGDEDHLGDMDFKVAGTQKGITACQMDIKVEGISFEVLKKALAQAYEGRMHILKEMFKTLSQPRAFMKPNAPKIYLFDIPKEFIGAIIGPGGKIIQEIQADTDTTITIEEKGKLGLIEIMGRDQKKIDQALQRIKFIAFVPEVGGVYEAKVKSIKEFGAFVEIVPGKEYLLHISEINWGRLEKVEDVLKIGDKIQVKLMGIDERNGKMRISRKVLFPRPEEQK